MTTVDLAHQMTIIAAELATLGHLPELRTILVSEALGICLIPKSNYMPWDEVMKTITWAEHFGADLDLMLSRYGGSGKVTASFTVAGVVATVEADISTATAYDLGRVLQKPLDAVESLMVTPERLRAVIAELSLTETS